MPDERTGVLYLAPWVTIGGSDRNTVDWVRFIDRERFRPYLMTTQESPNELFPEAARHAEEAWALPELMSGSDMPRFIAETVAGHDIRVLHVMNSRLGFDLLPALKRRFPHLRAVAQLHAEEHPAGTGYPKYAASRVETDIDAYSVISESLRKRLRQYGVPDAKQHVIRLGVDTSVFDPDRTRPLALDDRGDGFRVLFPARLTWQKDPLLMVEVARRLRARGSSIVIDAVGDGDLWDDVRLAVERHGLAGTVRMHGSSFDMPAWYAACDAVLLTSRYEGVPLAIFEAFAMGRPVVVAAVGGIAEVVDAGVGFLVERRDDPDAFVEALLALEADAGLRARMGRVGRERARHDFSVDEMARRHERLYEELLADAPGPDGPPDLGEFDDWWADDTEPLWLHAAGDGAGALAAGRDTPEGAALIGRIFTQPFPGTLPLVESGGVYRTEPVPGGRTLGHVLAYGLPGMVDVWTAGRRGARLASLPEPAVVSEVAPWIDTPHLLPEAPPPRRRWHRRLRSGARGG